MAVIGLGARVGELTIRVGLGGYRELKVWARSLGAVRAFGIEGTGSYDAGLARFLRAAGHTVHEAGRPDRGRRHRHGKTDHLDAEGAARAVLSGQATALPKAGTSVVEMIRHLKVARDTAVKARTQAMLALKAIMISAPPAQREQLEAVADRMALVWHLAALRPGPLTTTTASAKASLRAIARRWLDLDVEIRSHDAHLDRLTERCAPEMLILVDDEPERIHSKAAFAKLCGACPVPASSGKTSRHRLNRGGHRQVNAALHRVVVVRMRTHQPSLDYVRRRTAEGKSKREIIRCLKRFVAREVFGYLCRPPMPPAQRKSPLDRYRSIGASGRCASYPAASGFLARCLEALAEAALGGMSAAPRRVFLNLVMHAVTIK
ncbi:Transposase [Belnapia rosea]|nr:Transposase [Belnapia rosea]